MAVGIGVSIQDELLGQTPMNIDNDGAQEIGGDFNGPFILLPMGDIDDGQSLKLRLPVLNFQGLTIFRGEVY